MPETNLLAICSVPGYKQDCKANTIQNSTKYIHLNLYIKTKFLFVYGKVQFKEKERGK